MREIALHMADIAENSLAAGAARIKLSVIIDRAADRLTTAVEDNGRGMDADTLYRCTDPFMTTRTARRVGLGIALFKLSAEQSGGTERAGPRHKGGGGLYHIRHRPRAAWEHCGHNGGADCGESRNGLYFGIRGGRQSLCLRNGHDTIS